jgi:hypothetical protein
MGKLIKRALSEYVPGNPGNPGSPYIPASPGHWAAVPVTTCTSPSPTSVAIKVYPGQTLFEVLGVDADAFEGQLLSVQEVDENGDGHPEYTLYVVQYSAVVCSTVNTYVYTPPSAAVPAVPASPPTPAQMIVSLNQGWNSYARSVGQLAVGSLLDFTVKLGTYGAFMAIGPSGMEGATVDAFSHGVLVDTSGIYVIELGSVVEKLADNAPDVIVQILRLADGTVAYAARGVVHISATTIGPLSQMFAYGMLYSAYDEVTTAAFATGAAVAQPRVTMRGYGDITATPAPRATMSGYGTLLVSAGTAVVMDGSGQFTGYASIAAQLDVTMSGEGELLVVAEAGGRGSVALRPIQMLGGEPGSEYLGFGSTELPMIDASGAAAVMTPAVPSAGYSNLAFMTVWGYGSETDIGDGDISLPVFIAQAAETTYCIGDTALPIVLTSGTADFVAADELSLFSTLLAGGQHAQSLDLVMVFNSSGGLESVLAMTRLQAMAFMSMLAQDDSLELFATYAYSVLSTGALSSVQSVAVGDAPDLHDGVVWAVNRDNSASSQYEQFGFNSFFQRGTEYYGVANDGVYLLGAGNDAGADISALIEMGRTNLGYTSWKRVREVLLGVGSSGELYLKVDVDGQVYVYRTRSYGEAVRDRTVEVGWNVMGDYWDFTLVNPNGADFNLASVSFYPVPLPRRG